jgi:EAL domain-containing protein (putative c-di-GMP-specific phosphodiesterase class I)
MTEAQRAPPVPEPQPQPRIDFERREPAEPARAAAREPAQPGAEHLELLFEPVIELSTGSTMHYRALMDLTDEHGNAVRHAELMRKAEDGGMRAALDAHLVKLVTPVLHRLRGRNPGMRVFVPLGRPTLESREECEHIAAGLSRDVDVAGGLVFEIDFRELGALDDAGIGNLARLARLGVTLSLANVQVHGLDLASLRQLGVRYVSLPPHAVDAGAGPSPAAREFLQYARAMHFQIVIANIMTAQQAAAATKYGRFAYGGFFAPPRKVRADAGATGAQRGVSAA